MKVLILGAGAVGLSVAAKLSNVCEVHAVARERCALAVESGGFRLTGIWGEGEYRFPVSGSVPEGERYDYAILSSKAIDTEAICSRFSGALRGTETLSLQNGVGNEEIVARGAARGIATPVNSCLVDLVRFRESLGLAPTRTSRSS
jgi:2-dehydropantoate 2-reductase